MPLRNRPPRWLLLFLGVVLSGATALASALWMIASGPQGPMPTVELGFANTFVLNERAERVDSVVPGSPAAKAGLRSGDRIESANTTRLDNPAAITTEWARHQPGDIVRLVVRRAGQSAPIELQATFRHRAPDSPVGEVARRVYDLYPVPFVVVAVAVLFLRIEDRNAWLMALLFFCMVQTPGVPGEYAMFGPGLRAFALVHSSLSLGLVGPLFYFFFAVFPERSPLDRRWPWLKWAMVLVSFGFSLPGFGSGGLRLPPPLAGLAGEAVSTGLPIVFLLACFALGLVALAAGFVSTKDAEARRKIRVMLAGTLIGVLPALVSSALTNFTSIRTPEEFGPIIPLVTVLLPLSFAYAVVRHRVLEIPVLIRRSARYLLVQRGFLLLVSVASIGLALLFASWLTRSLPGLDPTASIMIGAVIGTALLWGGANVQRRVSGRVDRAFFRSAYDARVILEDLAERTRAATDREAIGRLLAERLGEALRPAWLVAYLEQPDGQLTAVTGPAPGGLDVLVPGDPLIVALAERGRPWDEAPAALETGGHPSALDALHAECLVPVLGHSGRMVGLLALGRRLSEEPYAGEDRRLLASVAAQTATALENIRLAEEIGRRMESERRAAREMDIARQVQARLLPDAPPPLATLDCAARCVQARDVGGDGYDFLDLGPGRVGFVLADVSGKGIHAALLMANLQAHIRSQSVLAPLDPVRVLSEVNRLLFRSTATEHYATVFLGVYDDGTRRLRYANGGLIPPVLLPGRPGAAPVRLMPTAPAVGLFDEWQGTSAEIEIGPGDLLALFSDGLTEAMHGEDEFGEERFVAELLARRTGPVPEIVGSIVEGVQTFSAGSQYDDITLVVARGRGHASC